MEINKDQERYIKTIREWQKSQDLLIQQINLNIHNAEQTIRIQSEVLKNCKDQLGHEVEFTENGMKMYFEWCEQNNIDPYITL